MGGTDKLGAQAEELKGRAKEAVGDATDNEELRSEGAADEMSGKAKQAVEDIKQAGRDLKD